MSVYVGNFATGSGGSTGATINLSIPFTAAAIFFLTSGQTSSGDVDVGQARMGYGFCASNGQRAWATTAVPSGTNARANSRYQTDCCVVTLVDGGSTVDGKLSLQSLAGGGVLEVTDTFATSRNITFIALDSNAFQAEVSSLSVPGSTGNQTISGHSFKGDAVIFGCPAAGITANNGTAGRGNIGLGMATEGAQGVVTSTFFTNVSQEAYRYSRSNECIASTPEPNINNRAKFVAFTADGFTINWLERNAGLAVPYLLIRGNAQLKVFSTPTDTNEFTETFTDPPLGALFFTSTVGQTTQDAAVTNNHTRLSIGVASGAAQRAVAMAFETRGDGENPGVRSVQRSARVMAKPRVAAGNITTREMQVNDINGMKLQMSLTVETGAMQMFVLAFLDEAPSGAWWQFAGG